jgi:type IV secretory pathway component VirB8
MDPELERKNIVLAWWLFGIFLALLAVTALVAVVVVYG